MEKTILDFKEQMKKEDLSQATINSYVINVELYKKYMEEKMGYFSPGEILDMDIKEYKSFLLNVKKEKPGTINKKLITLSKYCEFLVNERILEKNPAAGVGKIKIQKIKSSPKVLSKNDLFRFKREFYKENNLRDIAIFEILYNTGIRVSELCDIEYYQEESQNQKSDFNLSDRKGELTIRSGKGSKHRSVPLNVDARKAISDYLEVRPDTRAIPERNKLIQGERGNLNRQAINKIIKKYSNRAGFENSIHPHSLRHQLGRDLIRNGSDIISVAEILGHSDINTTRRYTLPTEEEKINALENL